MRLLDDHRVSSLFGRCHNLVGVQVQISQGTIHGNNPSWPATVCCALLRTKTFSEYDQASTYCKRQHPAIASTPSTRTSKINATGDSVDRRGKGFIEYKKLYPDNFQTMHCRLSTETCMLQETFCSDNRSSTITSIISSSIITSITIISSGSSTSVIIISGTTIINSIIVSSSIHSTSGTTTINNSSEYSKLPLPHTSHALSWTRPSARQSLQWLWSCK